MRAQRPHGTLKTGIDRAEYEDSSKRVRFRMYQAAARLAGYAAADPVVVIGHHIDDVDENRLAELGKGNLLRVPAAPHTGQGARNSVQHSARCA